LTVKHEESTPEQQTDGEYVQLQHKGAEMKRTWQAGVIGPIKLAGGFGDLRTTMDGEYSPYFHERRTGSAERSSTTYPDGD
jgi:hypothetical protein